MIENLSFIIIALNEEFAVDKCLSSILSMPLKNCEVIAVDSNSSDKTLFVMKSYIGRIENLRIIKIAGLVNAASARNAGMKYTTKPYIYFVDGDVELYPEFIEQALYKLQTGGADAVTGKLLEIQYCNDYKNEIRKIIRRAHITEESNCLWTGGIFITTKHIIEKVGAWDVSYARHQDMHYTLRLSRVGKISQLPEFIGIHHSQEYHDRNWEHFKKGYPILYGRLLRENIDRPLFVLNLLRANRGLATFLLINTLILFLALLASLLPSFTWLTVATITIVLIGIDFTYSTIVKKFNTPQWLLHNYLSPAIIIYGFLKKESLQKRQTEIELIE